MVGFEEPYTTGETDGIVGAMTRTMIRIDKLAQPIIITTEVTYAFS